MYQNSFKTILVITIVIILNGCTHSTPYNKERELSENSAVFIDAKQRGVYRVKKTEINGKTTWEGVCAEPSPDAISSFAATLGGNLSLTGKGNLGVFKSLAESVSSIGIRTVAIEALRDIMYRNCEAYALGGVSDIGLETLQRRFQSTMIAILAIEQLTGAVRAPAITLVSDLINKTEAARIFLNLAKESESKSKSRYEKSIKEREATEKKITDGMEDLSTQLEKNKADEESAKKEYETDQATTKEREQALLKALDASRVAALTGGGSVSTSAIIEILSAKPALSDAATKTIATAVFNIVKAATSGLNYGHEVCVTLIGQNPNVKPEENSALAECRNILASGKMATLLVDGKQLKIDGNYVGAIKKYKEVLLIDDTVTEATTAIEKISKFLPSLVDGKQLKIDGNYVGAIEKYKEVLLIDDTVTEATTAIEKISKFLPSLVDGRQLEIDGNYVGAIEKYKEVLLIDDTVTEATTAIKEIKKKTE